MKFACKQYYGLTIAVLFDIFEQPLSVIIQRNNALNLGEITQGQITKYDNAIKGYFAETEKKVSVFIPSKEKPYSIGQKVSIQITKEARLGKDANGVVLKQESDSFCPSVFSLINEGYAGFNDESSSQIIDGHLIEELLETNIYFAEGARLHIERTKTCYTIDVDSAQSSHPIEKINEEACYEIARQILLKNISGIIEIDFAGIKTTAEQKKLTLLLQRFLFADKRSKICGFTRAKLCEITRKRTSASLFDIFLTPQGRKNPCFLNMEIQEKLLRRYTGRPLLQANPILINQMPEEFSSLCKIVPNLNLKEDEYILKGENDG